MSERTYIDTCSAGALLRRHMRVQLDLLGVEWTEHKGLIESTFVVTGTADQFARLNRWVARVNAA